MIDIMLAGDNAIVVGALAAGAFPTDQRKKVIMIGILAALVLRIIFALMVTQLMQVGRPDLRQQPAAALLGELEDVSRDQRHVPDNPGAGGERGGGFKTRQDLRGPLAWARWPSPTSR